MKKLTLIFIFALALNTAFAARWYATPLGNGAGTSWANPTNLRVALINATSGDEIWVKADIYTSYLTSAASTFTIKSGVAMYGGFAGTETALAQRNFVTNVTVLDGSLNGNPYCTHVVTASNTTANTRIDGFKIINGNADNNKGGGIYCNSGSPTIINCTFSNNKCIATGTTGQGAAIGVDGTSIPKIQNCAFINNSGVSIVYSSTGNLTKIQNCTFTYNQATSVFGGTALIDRCKFSANIVSLSIINSFGSVTLTSSLIVGNSSTQYILYPYNNDNYINNTIAHNANTGANIQWDGTGYYYGNNYIGQNSNNTMGGMYTGVPSTNSNSNQPKFINGATAIDAPFDANDYDYHLQASSPLIDAGENNVAPVTNDLDNFPRIVGSSVDIGAYEYGTVGTFFDKDMSAAVTVTPNRSEERRVGKECCSWCIYRWSPYH